MNLRNVDGGDALFKIAAEMTGETSFKRSGFNAPGGITERTNELVGTLVSAIDARIAARFEPELRRCLPIVTGSQTVRADVAPVVREIKGEVGDRFERREGLLCDGTEYEVTHVREDAMRLLSVDGDQQYFWTAWLTELRDPSLFRFISSANERAAAKVAIAEAGEAPAEMAVQSPDDDEVHAVKVGDRFRRTIGFYVGEVYTVDRFDNDGDAWGNLCDIRRCIAVDELLDASRWTRVVAPEDVVSDDGSDPDTTAGNLRTAAEILIETDTAIADLIRAWDMHRETGFGGVQGSIEALADKAGLPVPWTRPE